MATHERRIGGDGRATTSRPAMPSTEPQVTDLIRQLGREGGDLVRSEVALAKLEMREVARQVAVESAKVFAAIALAATGVLALVAAAVIGLGNLLDGRYALAALIVGVVLAAIGGILANNGINGLKQDTSPDQTVDSLKATGRWAGDEFREFKDEIRS